MDADIRQLFAVAYQGETSAAAEILARGLTNANAVELARDAAERLDALLASLPDTRALACRAKCSWCCYERVACSPLEAIAVATYVQSRLVKRDRASVVSRLDAYADRVSGLDADAKNALRLPCPFLEGGVCVVHKTRPLMCRAWHSYDVEQCRSRKEGTSAGVSVNGVRLQLRVVVSGALRDAVERAGQRHPKVGNLDLAAAVRLVLEQPDAVAAWLRGEDAFAAAEYGERARDGGGLTAE